MSRVIQGLAQKQANKIYAEVVSVVRNKRDENYTILIPLVTKTHTGKTQTKYNRYTGGYDYEESTIPTGCKWKRVSICCKKLNDEEASIAFVARKYFEVKADKPEAPFDIILKDLRLWAKALPNTYL